MQTQRGRTFARASTVMVNVNTLNSFSREGLSNLLFPHERELSLHPPKSSASTTSASPLQMGATIADSQKLSSWLASHPLDCQHNNKQSNEIDSGAKIKVAKICTVVEEKLDSVAMTVPCSNM